MDGKAKKYEIAIRKAKLGRWIFVSGVVLVICLPGWYRFFACVLFFIAGFCLPSFEKARCPKCGERVFVKKNKTYYTANLFRNNCANCGLKLS